MKEQRPAGRRGQELLREKLILRAAIEELALTDYGGMSIDNVAQRAGVNKTTVYRKWETKAELIRAALSSVFEMFRIGPTLGDLRSDLRRIGQQVCRFAQSFEGKSLTRLHLLRHPEPELAEIANHLHAQQLEQLGALIEAAVARGEISRDVDILLLLDMLWGVLYTRLEIKNEPVSDALLEKIIDVLMCAARSPQVATKSKSHSRRAHPPPVKARARGRAR
jgi:AcrR family transcriptional regulator